MYYFNADPSTPSIQDNLQNARVTHYFDGEQPAKDKRRRHRREQKRRRQERRDRYQY